MIIVVVCVKSFVPIQVEVTNFDGPRNPSMSNYLQLSDKTVSTWNTIGWWESSIDIDNSSSLDSIDINNNHMRIWSFKFSPPCVIDAILDEDSYPWDPIAFFYF